MIIDKSKLKYILFDLDGTLTDSAPGITRSVAYALKKMGIESPNVDELKKFIGPPLTYSFKAFFSLSESEAALATQYYRERFSVKGLFENALYPGIEALLKDLFDNGKKLIVATGKPEEYSIQILEHFNVAQYFCFVCGNTLNDDRPQKADVINHIKSIYPINLDNAVMIGDRCYDIEAAKMTGLPSIGVTYGFGSKEELDSFGANLIVDSVCELSESLLD